MNDIVIRAEGLGKKYLIGHEHAAKDGMLRDAMTRAVKGLARSTRDMLHGRQTIAGDSVEEFWALKDVNFEIRRGEVVGVIGRNGAGKSTLLKVLSRITEPTTGRIEIKGRVASLLEVGTGFHPELTGRENIYLNGAILGMTQAEIRRKFDEIVAFAEVEKFLDTPVKRYSSGMYVRLAFAVAAHLEPEILIVDEVLAVGDAEFQKKCLGKMQDVAGHGRTVLFVSHNMGAVASLCGNGMLLSHGEVLDQGPIQKVLQTYQGDALSGSQKVKISGGFHVEITRFAESPDRLGEIEFTVKLEVASETTLSELALLVYSSTGVRLFLVDLRECLSLPSGLGLGVHEVIGAFGPIVLTDQSYEVGLHINHDNFLGNIMSLCRYVATPRSKARAPYPTIHRGFFDVDVSARIKRWRLEKV